MLQQVLNRINRARKARGHSTNLVSLQHRAAPLPITPGVIPGITPGREWWKQDCIDSLTHLIDENPPEYGIDSCTSYLSSIINWMWGSKIPRLKRKVMDID